MYVITGATGNTGKIITEKLLAAGKAVRIISRSEEKAKPLLDKGAELVISDLSKSAELIENFRGAEAVYVMTPPNYIASDYIAYQKKCAEVIAESIEQSGVQNVVALSSLGAQLDEPTGVVDGARYMEKRFNEIPGVNILFLRPAYFMENTFGQIPVIKDNGIMGSPVKGDLVFPMIATKDIGEYAAKRLLNLDFTGKSYQNLLGERDLSYNEVAKVFGAAIGKEDLKYVEFPYEGLKKALMNMGASENLADNMNQFVKVLNSGKIAEGILRDEESSTQTSIEKFAETFAFLYKQ